MARGALGAWSWIALPRAVRRAFAVDNVRGVGGSHLASGGLLELDQDQPALEGAAPTSGATPKPTPKVGVSRATHALLTLSRLATLDEHRVLVIDANPSILGVCLGVLEREAAADREGAPGEAALVLPRR